jgi:hypothetical protein
MDFISTMKRDNIAAGGDQLMEPQKKKKLLLPNFVLEVKKETPQTQTLTFP